jgi:arginase family enzyme
MDLSYAPGISTPSPFGLSPREVLTVALAFCDSQTIGAEIVELAPINDEKERTSKLAAAMLVELARSMVKG